MIAFKIFRGNPSTIVIPDINRLSLPTLPVLATSFDSPTLLQAAVGAAVQYDADLETDALPDAGPKTIQSKFLECIVNQQAAAAREQAFTRLEFVDKPKNVNQSDPIFQNLPKTGIAQTDLELK